MSFFSRSTLSTLEIHNSKFSREGAAWKKKEKDTKTFYQPKITSILS